MKIFLCLSLLLCRCDKPPTTPPAQGIRVARSTDGGATFSPSMNLSNDTGWNPQSGIMGSTVFVVWHSLTLGQVNNDILMARSTDSGATFSAPINLSNNMGHAYDPQIGIVDSTVFVVWRSTTPVHVNNDILMARSTDGGATFDAPVNLSNTSGHSWSPHIEMADSIILVAWEENTSGRSHILIARSINSGATFGPPINLSNKTSSPAFPQIGITDPAVLVVWYDNTPENRGIVIARSTDRGATFSTPVRLSPGTHRSWQPQVRTTGATVLVVWDDGTPENHDILMARSTDSGATFRPSINLSNTSGYSLNPQMGIVGSTVLVAWEDLMSVSYDILIARSTDGGATFSPPVNISNNTRSSWQHQIGITSTAMFVAWKDS